MRLPDWPPRDWRALLALLFSVLGAVVLSVFVWWAYAQLLPSAGWSIASETNRATTLRWTIWIAVGSIGLVLISLGMAINRRRMTARWGDKSAEFEGGDDVPGRTAAPAPPEGAGPPTRPNR